jgi:hypothetical protein
MLERRLKMKTWFAALALLSLLAPPAVQATTQIEDKIYLEGQKHPLFTLPLEQHYGPHNPRPKFRAPHTACWRGYVAIWDIKDGVLYLKDIQAWTQQGEVGLEALFPGTKGPVPATWFSGQLKVPEGKAVRRSVPYPVYEKYRMITVEKGRVVRQEVIDNAGRVPPPRR